MTKTFSHRGVIAAAWLAVAGLAVQAPMALAQAKPKAMTMSDAERVSAKVKIKSIDKATRRLTVTTAAGETYSMKASPDMRNFDQLKVGDSITATYAVEVGVVVSPPNTPLPKDTDTTVAARAKKGELPAAGAANYIVVSGNIIGIDKVKNTVKIVSTKGGEVHTVSVKTADGQAILAKSKVGDKISIYALESLIVSTTPA